MEERAKPNTTKARIQTAVTKLFIVQKNFSVSGDFQLYSWTLVTLLIHLHMRAGDGSLW